MTGQNAQIPKIRFYETTCMNILSTLSAVGRFGGTGQTPLSHRAALITASRTWDET